MHRHETFGECLKRCLQQENLSASEAARLVGFRSRNSIFRILAGNTGSDVNLRFMQRLNEVLGSQWPKERWYALQDALSIECLGPVKFRANRAFSRVLHDADRTVPDYVVQETDPQGKVREVPLFEVLKDVAAAPRAELVITGCCESGIARVLEDACGAVGAQGRLSVRHYIDVTKDSVTENILGILPLVSKAWYNARLVDPEACPPEMMAIYRLHAIHVQTWDEAGRLRGVMFIRFDDTHFAYYVREEGSCPPVNVLDRWRFDLELLKPIDKTGSGPDVYLNYTQQYASLEDNCAIYSIKPDPHFNCIPSDLLEQAVLEGFAQAGLAAGPELNTLISQLKLVHDRRFDNMINKRKPTHLVYSLPVMEQFMRTGVLSDQFFLQRAYTVEERRRILRVLLDTMREKPYFNVHFLRPEVPELRYEISCYDGKGVLLMDAYTGYELHSDHSEALITLPAFMEGFKSYFNDELLKHYVMSRADTIRALEQLLVMNVQE